ncbi:hypothetical protein [Marinicella meishanensis]|uniref:hypothetical protein n=1 Tax=Marinicella meishanensis TaxID=2873263 RepID=UPI001CBBC0DA|nr:hypothetical protein [Marinicella sp. NBU2979]
MKTRRPLIALMIWLGLLASPLIHAQQPGQALLPEANRDFEFDYTTLPPMAFESFEAAAEWADVVAIAQLLNVDYEQTRELNAKGQAFLTVRVPYKGVQKDEFLIVSSKGFEDHVCYYPNREGEGQRFLVFLKRSKNEGEYLGFKPMCQLQVLLTDTGQYALRYPFDSNTPVPEGLVQTMQFGDPHARIDATEWTSIRRDEHQQKFASELSEDSDLFQKYFYLTYTQGVMMYEIRKLMNIQAQPRIHSKQM